MATERRRAARLLALLPAAVMVALPSTVRAAQAWWEPLAFAGQRVDALSVSARQILVGTASGAFLSADGGHTFAQVGVHSALGGTAQTGSTQWEIRDGTVYTGASGPAPAPDPRAPFLGHGAHLIAAPVALPGVVVAVGTDNHVWRRAPSGKWSTAFILLPAGGLSGTPPVTALAAFARPLSAAVYLGTDGYGVLVSQDGGDDWIRADPGLPAGVLALATDPSTRAVYAATDQGLFVHHLQSFPAPPVYSEASLHLKWVGIALVSLLAAAAAVLCLRRALPQA